MSVSIVLLWGNHGAVVGHLVAFGEAVGLLWGQAWAFRGNHGDVVEYLGAGMGHLRVFKGQAWGIKGH